MALPFRNFVDPIIESLAPNKRSEGGIKDWPRVFPDVVHIHHRLGSEVKISNKPKQTVIDKDHVTTLAIFDHNFLEFVRMHGTRLVIAVTTERMEILIRAIAGSSTRSTILKNFDDTAKQFRFDARR